MSRWLLLAFWLGASGVSAQGKLFVLTPAINEAQGPAAGRNTSECLLDEIVANDVFNAVQARTPEAVKVKKEAEAGDGRLLRLTIYQVIGWGGGGWSGPKWLGVRGELLQGGQLVRSSSWRLSSRGGVLGPVKGTCDIFEDISRTIAPRVSAWLVVVTRDRPGQPASQPPAEERKDGDAEKQ